MNELTVRGDWTKQSLIFIFTSKKIERIWYDNYRQHHNKKTIVRYNMNRYHFEKYIERISKQYVNSSKWLKNSSYQSLQRDLLLIILDIYITKPSFFKRNFLIKKIYTEYGVCFFEVYFSQSMYSYIKIKCNLKSFTNYYLNIVFSETEENKRNKKKELNELHIKCLNLLYS